MEGDEYANYDKIQRKLRVTGIAMPSVCLRNFLLRNIQRFKCLIFVAERVQGHAKEKTG
jgi:hypothetical protein